jgi:hypothetical protein
MTECFCGCGRSIGRFPIGNRSINKRGVLVAERLAYTYSTVADPSGDVLGPWVAEGKAVLSEIEFAQHVDDDEMGIGSALSEYGIDEVSLKRDLDPDRSSRWLEDGRGIEALMIGQGHLPLKAWLRQNSRERVLEIVSSIG